MMLTYVPKRIHFSTSIFKMRMNLAVLDWVSSLAHFCYNNYIYDNHDSAQNENVNQPHTSSRRVADLRRPDRRTELKVLVEKTYNFVDHLWASYVANNISDIELVMLVMYTCRLQSMG